MFIPDDLLTTENKQAGFSIRVPDDHILELVLNGEVVARFTHNATVTTINTEANKIRVAWPPERIK